MDIMTFKMPRYHEIPKVGLYLEQTVKYINESLEPLGCVEITSSMISNYVKKRYIERPVRKQYSEEQIARLFFIVIAKQVLSMENIVLLFGLQNEGYSVERAYDKFCDDLEEMLHSLFTMQEMPEEQDEEIPEEIRMLRSVIIAVSHIIYLNHRFRVVRAAAGDGEAS